MIYLDEKKLIGKGSERSCYYHPNNENYCIKVIHTMSKRSIIRSDREINYIRKYKSKKTPFKEIPDYYGSVHTNIGKGYIFERVKDWNGENSIKLSEYIKEDGDSENIRLMILDMYNSFIKHRALVSDLHSGNIVVNLKNPKACPKLILIDGIGNSDFIKISDYSYYLLKKKLIRKFSRMMHNLKISNKGIQ